MMSSCHFIFTLINIKNIGIFTYKYYLLQYFPCTICLKTTEVKQIKVEFHHKARKYQTILNVCVLMPGPKVIQLCALTYQYRPSRYTWTWKQLSLIIGRI